MTKKKPIKYCRYGDNNENLYLILKDKGITAINIEFAEKKYTMVVSFEKEGKPYVMLIDNTGSTIDKVLSGEFEPKKYVYVPEEVTSEMEKEIKDFVETLKKYNTEDTSNYIR